MKKLFIYSTLCVIFAYALLTLIFRPDADDEKSGKSATLPEPPTTATPLAVSEEDPISKPSPKISPEPRVQDDAWTTASIESLSKQFPNYGRGIDIILRAVAFEDFAALPTHQAEHLVRYSQAVSSQTADQIVPLCWAHSTPRAIVSAYESVRSLALTESDAIGEPLPAFQGNSRWSRTATDKNTGSEGTPVTLRWSFVPDGTTVPESSNNTAAPSDLIKTLNDAYGPPTTEGDLTTAPWFKFFDYAFASWAAITGNIYVYEPNDDGGNFPSSGGSVGVRGDVRIAGVRIDGNGGLLGFNEFPDLGDMVIDSDESSLLHVGSKTLFQNVISHEHGHGLGLYHVCPINSTKLMEPRASSFFTGPQLDDILTAQGLYGDPLERSASSKNNNTIATASDLGTLNSDYTASAISISNSNDIDIFAFEVDAPRQLNVSVTPTSAAAYLEGAENNNGSCSAGTLFDPQTRQDLSIRVLAPNGSIVLGSSNSAGIGQAETLDSIKLIETNQSYYIEVTGGGENSADVNNAQLYALEIELADLRAVIPKDFIITNESCSPANGSPDPDERITSSITVENLDSETATNVSITLSGSSNLTIQGNATQNIGTLTPGQTMDVVYTFSLSGNCADAESITFRVDTATDFIEHTEAFTLGTNQIISSENFDSTPLDQIPTGYSQDFGNRGTNWRTTAASAASAPNSVFAPRHTTVNSSYLISPEITVNNHSFELRFDHDHNTEDLFDGGILEISINDGTWTEWIAAGGSFAKNGSNREINSEWRSPIGGQNAWSGDSGGFIQTIANFPPSAIGQTVRVRWHLASDQLNFETISEGWWIDNVEIYGLVCCKTMIPTLSVTAPSPTVAEFTPATTTDFIISSDMVVSGDLSVAYTLSGSATADSDFVALAGTASILDSQSMVAIPVTAITDSMIEGDEHITLTISPSDNYGIDTAVASITIKDLPFDAFRHENFGGATTKIAAAEDFDSDRILNLVEYAFRLDPTTSSTLPFSLLVESDDEPTLTLTYHEDTRLADVNYIVETSTTLLPDSWSTTGITLTDGTTSNGLLTKTASIPIRNNAGFIRVRIERMSP